MRPSQLTAAITRMAEIKQPTFIWGPPGVGKSDIVANVAGDLGMDLVDVRVLLLDPVDLRGLPSVVEGVTCWNPPAFLPQSGKGILFLDELNAAPPMIQAACYQLVLNRKIGEYELPAEWSIIAAGNRESDGAVTSRMPTALRNRFTHLECEVNSDDWSKWAVSNGIEAEVLAFIRYRPELLYQFSRDDKAFPTPRSWAFVSRIIAGNGTSQDVEHALIQGTVGEGAAIEFSAYLRLYRDLPSIDAILLNPSKEPVPHQPATMYAVASALGRKMSPQNIGRAIVYLSRLPAEFGVMAMKDGLQRDSKLKSCAEVTKWAIANQDIVF